MEENDVDREKLKLNFEEHIEELPGIYLGVQAENWYISLFYVDGRIAVVLRLLLIWSFPPFHDFCRDLLGEIKRSMHVNGLLK